MTEKIRGGHFGVDDDSEIEMLEWVQTQAEKHVPITRTDLRNYFEVKYSLSISRGLVRSFILRHRADFIETKITPKEKREWKFRVRFEIKRNAIYENTSKG
jgi:hypothetical protein